MSPRPFFLNRHRRPRGRPGRVSAAFTLAELLVSITVLSLMLLLVFQMLDETQKTWARAKGMTSAFKEARDGFEAMNRIIPQATLNTYLGYDVNPTSGLPRTFERKSELHFVSAPVKELLGDEEGRFRVTHAIFFQAPLGFQTIESRRESGSQKDSYGEMDTLLNGWGFYVEYASDKFERPPFLTQLSPPVAERWRYRLMEFRQPAEATTIYQYHLENRDKLKDDAVWEWFRGREFGVRAQANRDPVAAAGQIRTTRILAENIIALIISPRLAENDVKELSQAGGSRYKFRDATDIARDYTYDSRRFQYDSASDHVKFSRHQIPPMIRVTMVAVDEVDASRHAALGDQSKPPDYAPKDQLFTDIRDYGDDLAFLTKTLNDVGIRHRVFTSNIRMREGNFSKTY